MARQMPKPQGWHFFRADPILDEYGKPTCRWCAKPVRSPRRSFCSEECVFEWMRRTRWRITRAAVYELRNYRCEDCGIDVRTIDPVFCQQQFLYSQRLEKARKELDWKKWKPPLWLDSSGDWLSSEEWWNRKLVADRWCKMNKCVGRSPWDVDHKIPVSCGGDWFDFANLQLLCRPDHDRKTRIDGSRLTKKRNP